MVQNLVVGSPFLGRLLETQKEIMYSSAGASVLPRLFAFFFCELDHADNEVLMELLARSVSLSIGF